jgi:DNA-binding MarR family transcriptional regulator
MIDRVINSIYDEALRPFGLTASQMNILHMTAESGVARAADMCRTLHLDTSTISRNIDRMRKKELLEEVVGGDARSHPFRVTAAGRELLERADRAWREAQNAAAERLGDDGLQWLDLLSQRISPGLQC